jgi:hypothetical protein
MTQPMLVVTFADTPAIGGLNTDCSVNQLAIHLGYTHNRCTIDLTFERFLFMPCGVNQ